MSHAKYVLFFMAMLFIASFSFGAKQAVDPFDEPEPTSPSNSLFDAMAVTCTLFNTLLPIATMISITLSGIVFAIGQMLGAEVRARANVYASNLLLGSIIAGTVTVLTPTVVKALIPTLDMSQCAASTSSGGGIITQDDICKACLKDCPDECEVQCASAARDDGCYDRCIDSCRDACYACPGDCNPTCGRHGLPIREDRLE